MRTSQNTNNKQPFRKYMQEKLAITVLVITLALFALVLVLYNIVKNKGEDYNQIVLAIRIMRAERSPLSGGTL